MKNQPVVLITLCMALLLFGCAGIQGQTQGKNTAAITLEGNPTTGYSWVYTLSTLSPQAVIREVSKEYIPNTSDKNIVGSGGKFVFTFEAIAAGEADIIFSYRRAWEENTAPVKTISYRAMADNKNNLTLTLQ